MSKKQNNNKLSPRVIVKIVLLISIPVILVLAVLLSSGLTYINAWNNNQVIPYNPTITTKDDGTKTETDKISGIYLTDVTRLDNKDFNLFDINLEATYYNDVDKQKGQKVEFSVSFKTNENSPEGLTTISSSSTNKIRVALALCADWIKFESYTSQLYDLKVDGTPKPNITVKCTQKFPAYASTWPVPISVDSPTCYLYLYYRTQENGKIVEKSYILKYTYDEYMTSSTQGGIIK